MYAHAPLHTLYKGNLEYVTALDDALSEAFSAPVWREKVRPLEGSFTTN
jgi:hypothetical protein